MRVSKLAIAVVVGASLMQAMPGVAQPSAEAKAVLDQNIVGASRDGLCTQKISKQLDTGGIVFEKFLQIEPLTPGFAILEGPLWAGDRLLMSHIGGSVGDGPNPADLVALRDGKLEIVKTGYGSNGLALDASGAVIAARHADGTITRVADGQVLAEGHQGARFNSPNDLVLSRTGDIYFSDPDWQAPKPRPQAQERVYHVAPSGQITGFGAHIEKPNGVMLSLNQRTLYVGGTNGLYRFKLKQNGEVIDKAKRVEPKVIAGGVDGMSLDCAGNLFVTADGKVHVLNPGGNKIIATYEVPGVTNLAFGGSDGTTLYATTLGEKPQVWVAKTNIPGLPF